MRFMMIVKADKDSENGMMPSTELLATMGRYNEEMAKAGVMLSGEGLQPSSKGFRTKFVNGKLKAVDGPFAEVKELIAGFWIIQVKSREEALDWALRCPIETEVRQIFETEDFGDELTPELREQEDRIRAEIAAKK